MSKLVGILTNRNGELSRPLVTYLGLFRPPKRDLANDRALKLCQEVIELTDDQNRLAAALAQTVEMIRAKGGGPLKNHNYLKRVIESIDIRQTVPTCTKSQTGMSKAEQALISIENIKDKYG